MAANNLSINNAVGVRWDSSKINCTIDGTPVILFAGSGNMFTCTWTGTNVQVSADARGNGIELVNHNGIANLTLNMSREDPMSRAILNGQSNGDGTGANAGANVSAHEIIITTVNETLMTNTARLTKMPNITGASSAPNWTPVFACLSVKAQASNNLSEPITPYKPVGQNGNE